MSTQNSNLKVGLPRWFKEYLEVNLRPLQGLEFHVKHTKRDKVSLHDEHEVSVAQLYQPRPRVANSRVKY